MDSSTRSQLEEVASFLAPVHRNEVRMAALELLQPYVAEEKFHGEIVQFPGLCKSLALICSDASNAFETTNSVCQNAFAFVVNLSTSTIGRKALLEAKFVSRIIDFLDAIRRIDWKRKFSTGAETLRLAFMVLSNLTVEEEGQNSFLQIGTKLEGLHFLKLLKFAKDILEMKEIRSEKVDVLEFVPAVLTNLSQNELGRNMILDEKRQIFPLVVQLLAADEEEGQPKRFAEERRLGALRLIHNCAFELSKHDYMLQDDIQLIGVLLKPIIVPDLIDLEEWEEMPEQIKNRWSPSANPAATSKDEVRLICEIFDILVRKVETRMLLRSLNVYIVFREYDKTQEDEELTDLLYELVHWFILDEDELSNPKAKDSVRLEGERTSKISAQTF
jgi:hypothetical protein